MKLTDADHNAINSMRARGFAVVVFTDEEVGEMHACNLEDSLVEYGNEVLALFNPQPEDEEG